MLDAALDAVKGYLTHSAPGGALDHLLEQERILFCSQSRLLATLWVRSERGRYQGTNPMPDRLAGSCTTMAEALAICEATDPTLLITTQLLEVGSGLELVVEAKRRQPQLRTLLFLQYDHRTLLVVTWTPETEPVFMRASQPARLGQEKPHETQAPHSRADHPQAAHC